MSHSFISSAWFHLTVQMWASADELASYLENKGTLGMFHSVLKHAEHRTLNTYTQQLVLSKCSFFWVLFSDTEWLQATQNTTQPIAPD